MKLHTVFITYNRLELTKQAMRTYFDTVTVPFTVHVYDNGSEDGSAEWVAFYAAHPDWGGSYEVTLDGNMYPGYACNRGWESAPGDATHFQRADNDFKFLPGWCDEVERMFSSNEKLGQLGLRTDAEELNAKSNVGGNCIIDRRLWDKGLRWDERTWPELAKGYGPGFTEDSIMSHQITRYGWEWDRVEKPCIQSLSVEDPDNPYYTKSWEDRGILKAAMKAYGRL